MARELSLNFAAFARLCTAARQARTGRWPLRAIADGQFQIESLYKFNAKFFPRWEPRYVMYEGLAALPRVALASLWLEGQIPKPTLPRVPREPARH